MVDRRRVHGGGKHLAVRWNRRSVFTSHERHKDFRLHESQMGPRPRVAPRRLIVSMADQAEKAEVAKRPDQTTKDTRTKAETDADTSARITAEMKKEARPAWWALLILAGTSTSLLAFFGLTSKSWAVAWVELLLGATALSVGAFFGFLFGIPRAAAEDPGNSTYRPSTNLEQVSDWLTKILIGVGLVQLAAISSGLTAIGTLVSGTVSPPPAGVAIVSQLVVVVFLVIGFQSSFLWTRLYYGRIQTLTDRSLAGDMEQFKKEVERKQEDLKKEVVRNQAQTTERVKALARETDAAGLEPSSGQPGGLGIAPGTDSPVQLPAEVQEKVKKFMKAPRDWESDPTAELFPKATREYKGRRLEAEIASDLGDGLLINVRAVRVSGDALVGETLFLLHPTVPKRIHRVLPRGNVAETSFYAEGAFTVVAIADNGRTILAYDLVEMPGAPQWFKEA